MKRAANLSLEHWAINRRNMLKRQKAQIFSSLFTGMSKAAKGTIIGTVGGAAAGAIISKKNRGAGAVVGGIVGGATGYTIGRSKDKKDGNIQ